MGTWANLGRLARKKGGTGLIRALVFVASSRRRSAGSEADRGEDGDRLGFVPLSRVARQPDA